MKFRKRAVVIDAVQWFKQGDHPLVQSMETGHPADQGSPVPVNVGWIETYEGRMMVQPGDWIITGIKGEHYPCKPDIFAALYEPVEGKG